MPESRHRRLRDTYRAHRCLLHLHLDLTLRCPLRCPHCYVAGEGSRRTEMTTAEVVRVLEDARDLKVLTLLVSGGEPMLRPDFFEVLEAARRLRFSVHVKTTGLYLGAGEARRLAALAPIRVDLSIHGARAETHDRFVGMRGAFDRAVAAFEALREAGVRVGVRTNLVADNVREAREVEARFGLPGVDYRKGVAIFSRRDGQWPGEGLALDQDACATVLTRRSRNRKATRGKARGPDPASPLCGAAATTLYVAPDGDVFPCSLWPQRLGNARERGGLRAAFEGSEAERIRALTHGDRRDCLECAMRVRCPFCPGESVAEGLPATAPNRVACRLARAASGSAGGTQ